MLGFLRKKYSMSVGETSSITGSLGGACAVEWGRYGTAALRPLYLRRCSARKVLTRRIRAALQWFIKALRRFGGKAIAIGLQSQPLYITISDGVGRGSVAVGVWCQMGEGLDSARYSAPSARRNTSVLAFVHDTEHCFDWGSGSAARPRFVDAARRPAVDSFR